MPEGDRTGMDEYKWKSNNKITRFYAFNCISELRKDSAKALSFLTSDSYYSISLLNSASLPAFITLINDYIQFLTVLNAKLYVGERICLTAAACCLQIGLFLVCFQYFRRMNISMVFFVSVRIYKA